MTRDELREEMRKLPSISWLKGYFRLDDFRLDGLITEILSLIPEPTETMGEEEIEKILARWNITEELGLRYKLAKALAGKIEKQPTEAKYCECNCMCHGMTCVHCGKYKLVNFPKEQTEAKEDNFRNELQRIIFDNYSESGSTRAYCTADMILMYTRLRILKCSECGNYIFKPSDHPAGYTCSLEHLKNGKGLAANRIVTGVDMGAMRQKAVINQPTLSPKEQTEIEELTKIPDDLVVNKNPADMVIWIIQNREVINELVKAINQIINQRNSK